MLSSLQLSKSSKRTNPADEVQHPSSFHSPPIQRLVAKLHSHSAQSDLLCSGKYSVLQKAAEMGGFVFTASDEDWLGQSLMRHTVLWNFGAEVQKASKGYQVQGWHGTAALIESPDSGVSRKEIVTC